MIGAKAAIALIASGIAIACGVYALATGKADARGARGLTATEARVFGVLLATLGGYCFIRTLRRLETGEDPFDED